MREYYSKAFTMYFGAYELKSSVINAAVQSTAQGQPILRADFSVEFEAYNTSRAQDGFCVFSQHNALVVTKSSASTGQDLVSEIPVQVIYADIEMFSLAYWYGPPAFRIPVGGKYAIPAPPRQQANNFPGTYDDQDSNRLASCQPFFQIGDFSRVRHLLPIRI